MRALHPTHRLRHPLSIGRRIATHRRSMPRAFAFAALLSAVAVAGCSRDTSTLTPEWRQRFETEGIARRADNVIVRHTREAGRWDHSYKDRLASVLVTRETILIHQGDRVLLEVDSKTRRDITVTRQGGRIRIRAVGQRLTEIFSFEPREDAAGWAGDLRKVARLGDGKSP